MIEKLMAMKPEKQLLIFFMATIAMFYAVAFISASPVELLQGYGRLISQRDVLITDYFVVGGVGAAFLNMAVVMTLSLGLIMMLKLHFTGITIASVFIAGGFALFGKNPFNILPILAGSYLYARVQGVKMNRYIYVALFATGLAPIVTELTRILPYHPIINTIIAVTIGALVGFIAPPLAAHTISMHMGYNLFNVGFATGIIAMCVVALLRSFGLSISTVLVWQGGRPTWLIWMLYAYFGLTALYGYLIANRDVKSFFRILKHPGRAIADFVLMDGVGATLMNMGVVGMMCLSYIIFIGGDLSGPVVGAILTVFGFAAFGIHPKNYFPLLLGVFLATFFKIFTPTTPAMQLAALFVAGLSPIAGQFGVLPGVFAGFLHSSLVLSVGSIYGGINLYNNGFAAGFVAIIMLPIMESFIKRYTNK